MKRRSAQVGYLIPLALASYPVEAANLDVRVESGGAAAITVAPDDPIPFEVIGRLSDTNNGALPALHSSSACRAVRSSPPRPRVLIL